MEPYFANYICNCSDRWAEYSERTKHISCMSCMHAPGGYSDWNDPEAKYRWQCFQQRYVSHFDQVMRFGAGRPGGSYSFPDYNLNIFDSDVEEYESMDEFIGVEPSLKAFPRPSRVIDAEECPICLSLITKGKATLNCGHVFCMNCNHYA